MQTGGKRTADHESCRGNDRDHVSLVKLFSSEPSSLVSRWAMGDPEEKGGTVRRRYREISLSEAALLALAACSNGIGEVSIQRKLSGSSLGRGRDGRGG